AADIVNENGSELLKVDSARPVARAVLSLEARYGYVITYEDPRYSVDDDLIDAAPAVRKNYSSAKSAASQAGVGAKAPETVLPLPAATNISSQEMATLLDELVRRQGASLYGGHFRVEQTGELFHVLPAEVRDKSGNWSSQKSLLDVQITLPVQDRTEKQLYRA